MHRQVLNAKGIGGLTDCWVATLFIVVALGPGCHRQVPASIEIPADQVSKVRLHVAEVRGVRGDQAIRIFELSNQAFQEKLLENARGQCRQAQQKPGRVQDGLATWLPPENCDQVEVPPPRMGEEFAAGFFSENEWTVYLRNLPEVLEPWHLGISVDELFGEQQKVLGHEFFHALQLERFGSVKQLEHAEPDESLAAEALYEGDATLVGLIVEAIQRGYSWEFRLQKMLQQAIQEPHLANSYLIGFTPWYQDPENLDRAFNFSRYAAGLAFVVELHTEGGFARINQAYQVLPRTTEQILHSQKYLSGEQAIEVPAPRLPAGLEVSVSHRLGEMTTRALLSTCMDWTPACETAAGWGGDRLTLAEDGDDNRSMIWTVVWDLEKQAERFSQVENKAGDCIGRALEVLIGHQHFKTGKSPGQGSDSRQARNAGPKIVRQQGRKTALVLGLPEPAAEEIIRAFFEAPIVVSPPAPPPAISSPFINGSKP